MHINWYPGHMKKTKELIQTHLKLVDVVVELLDARIPISSRNPQIDDLVGDKPRIVLLNKYDLCDKSVLRDWIRYFDSRGIVAIPINSISGDGTKKLLKQLKIETKPFSEDIWLRNSFTSIFVYSLPGPRRTSPLFEMIFLTISPLKLFFSPGDGSAILTAA